MNFFWWSLGLNTNQYWCFLYYFQPSRADVCFLFDFSVCNQLNIINFTVKDVGSVPCSTLLVIDNCCIFLTVLDCMNIDLLHQDIIIIPVKHVQNNDCEWISFVGCATKDSNCKLIFPDNPWKYLLIMDDSQFINTFNCTEIKITIRKLINL